MNNRIKEFAIKSGIAELYDRYHNQCVKNGDDDIIDYEVVISEFSKLLLQDCINELNNQKCNSGVDRTPFFKGHDQAIYDCVNSLTTPYKNILK